ncbi:MAG TPA: hypothetical protein PLK95_05240 [Pseudothermotoga sp.]|nr:hypothetical protein [Pseudothermotoga sp.]
MSVAKQSKTVRFILMLCIILAVSNYTAGVFIYRGYVKRLSETSINCWITFEQDLLRGKIEIKPADGMKVFPVDYQIYFYDDRGNTLQLIADSLSGKLHADFETQMKEKLFSKQWQVVGYSNVKIRWLWLSMSLSLPIEVQVE